MSKSKLTTLFLSGAIFVFGTGAQKDCGAKKTGNSPSNSVSNNAMNNNTNTVETATPTRSGEIKIIAEGYNSEIEQPFLFVVRSAETYRQLQMLIKELPAAGLDFENRAVVAAFAGTKNTGGYSVEIKNSGEKVTVAVNNPPPDAMLTQALTSPYKIAAVPIEVENALTFTVSDNWKKAAQTYKLTSGDFESSGGIAGRMKKFSAEGTIEVWQFGDLATLKFNLTGTNADKNMRLTEIVSGTIKNGTVDLARLDGGSFSEGPKPPLKVSGTISGDRLNLNFEPLPTNIRDGFSIRGKLEAGLTK